jgi:hypothetical protein
MWRGPVFNSNENGKIVNITIPFIIDYFSNFISRDSFALLGACRSMTIETGYITGRTSDENVSKPPEPAPVPRKT